MFESLVFSSDKPYEWDLPESFTALKRPQVLCRDEVPHLASVKHAVYCVDAKTDWVILFQPTNPIRKTEELMTMMKLMLRYHPGSKPTIIRCYYEDTNVSQSYFKDALFKHSAQGVVIRSGTMYTYNRAYLSARQDEEIINLSIKVPKWRGYNINDKEDLYITEAFMDCHNYNWYYRHD
jgi:CMP-N-acetylneuraminic acid synthetase